MASERKHPGIREIIDNTTLINNNDGKTNYNV